MHFVAWELESLQVTSFNQDWKMGHDLPLGLSTPLGLLSHLNRVKFIFSQVFKNDKNIILESHPVRTELGNRETNVQNYLQGEIPWAILNSLGWVVNSISIAIAYWNEKARESKSDTEKLEIK